MICSRFLMLVKISHQMESFWTGRSGTTGSKAYSAADAAVTAIISAPADFAMFSWASGAMQLS
jgi:hypothetical protein